MKLFRHARYTLNQSPGGSGKSLTQCILGALDLQDTGNKQLVLVPQNHIHHGFFNNGRVEFRLTPEGEVHRWTVAHNFCAGRPRRRTKQLVEFLLADAEELRRAGRSAAIATHMAMVRAWRSMTVPQRDQAIRQTTFRIDEAHHIKGVFDSQSDGGPQSVEVRNGLGEFVQHVIDRDHPDTKLHLSTATFYRGDRTRILSREVEGRFVTFNLPWDEYYEMLKLRRFEYDFVTYDGDPVDQALEAVRREPNGRHLLILPSLRRAFRTSETLSRFLAPLRTLYGQDRVLDLVTPETQATAKAALLADPDHFRAVVACRLFDEGTDWPICDRMHNMDAGESSMTLAVQRFFRPFRYHPDKRTVRIVNYLQAFQTDMDDEARRRTLSDRFNAVLACVVTFGELIPIRVGTIAPKGRKAPADGLEGPTLQDVFGHEGYVDVIERLQKGYETLTDRTDPEQAKKLIAAVVEEVGVPPGVDGGSLHEALGQLLHRMSQRKNRKVGPQLTSAFDSSAIARLGFDKVWRKSVHGSIVRYGTDHIAPEMIRELVSLVRRPMRREEIETAIRSYHQRTGIRPTHKTGFVEEAQRNTQQLEKYLRIHHGTTLAREVDRVLGHESSGLLERTVDVVRQYAERGIRLWTKYGQIPELGITSFALNARLITHCGRTLASVVQETIGPRPVFDLDLDKVRDVIRSYARRGVRLHRKFGVIEELGISSYNLHERLMRSHGINLGKLSREEMDAVRSEGA